MVGLHAGFGEKVCNGDGDGDDDEGNDGGEDVKVGGRQLFAVGWTVYYIYMFQLGSSC